MNIRYAGPAETLAEQFNREIAELTSLNYRISFYPYGAGVAYQINVYGDDSRVLYGCVLPDALAGRLHQIVEALKAGQFLELVQV